MRKEKMVTRDLTNQKEEWLDGVRPLEKVYINGEVYVAPAEEDVEVSPMFASIVKQSRDMLNSANRNFAIENNRMVWDKKIDLA